MTPMEQQWPVGATVRDGAGRLYHVRAWVDGRPVLRTWRRSKQRWRYYVSDAYELDLWTRRGAS